VEQSSESRNHSSDITMVLAMKMFRRSNSQRGSVSTEGAIITPTFLLVCFASAQLMVIAWQALSVQMLASSAARDFALWGGCDANSNCTSTTGNVGVETRKAKLRERITGRSIRTFGLGSNLLDPNPDKGPIIEVALSGAATGNICTLNNNAGNPQAGDLITVTVSVRTSLFGFKYFPYNISGSAAAVVEQPDF
jgi:hypothetical protein